MTWTAQQGLRLLLLSLSVAFPASVCPGWFIFWANPKNTEFTLRTVPLGGPRWSRTVAGGNCGSPVHGARLKVSVGSAEAAHKDLRMFGVRSAGGLFGDHQRAAGYRRTRAAATF